MQTVAIVAWVFVILALAATIALFAEWLFNRKDR
jgi:hypothetical protein